MTAKTTRHAHKGRRGRVALPHIPRRSKKKQKPEWRGYTSQAMFLAKGPPNPAPGPRFHRAVAPPRKDCRPYESRPRACIPCDLAQRRAALGTMPNRPPVGCRQSLAALDRAAGAGP